jgi:flagellar biosynthesis protein FliQ
MGPGDVNHIISQALWTILIATGPILAVALAVGLGIALFQALTSIQEMTLTFVPKIAAIILGVIFTLPFIFTTLTKLTDQIFYLIISGGF